MESKRVKVTTDDLLEALQQALGPGDGEGTTVSDLCRETGANENMVRRKIRDLIAAGRCEVVRVRRTDMAGRHTRVPAYRLKS